MTAFRLNLSHNDFSALPTAIPTQLVEEEGVLVEGRGWKRAVARHIISGYAQDQDRKVTDYFLHFFKNIIAEKRMISPVQLKKIIGFAEQHLAERERYCQCFNLSSMPMEMGDLQRYVFAAKTQTNDFESPEQKEVIKAIVQRNIQALYAKWEAQRFDSSPADKEAFWTHPDLVDFIFENHLHRHIHHKDYNHHIEIHPSVRLKNGICVVEQEPYLKVNGQIKRWSDIRAMLKVENRSNRLYVEQSDGSKKYWMYLDEGFVEHDQTDMEHMRRFKKLESAPLSCKVQVITSYQPSKKQGPLDRLLKGARHTFFRVVIGKNFQRNHPNLPYKDGEVYSLGWGVEPGTVINLRRPLTSFQGQVYCPDPYEFFAQDLCVTELDVTDEKALRLFEVVKNRANNLPPFHYVASNCCTNGMGMLREAEIMDIPTKRQLFGMAYELIFPEFFQKYLDEAGRFVARWMPELIQNGARHLAFFLYSLVIAPLFTFLGAWRVNMTDDPETQASAEAESSQEGMVRVGNEVNSLFSSVFDLFDPNKTTIDMPLSVLQWQLKYGQEHPGKTTFVEQN